MSYRYIGNKTRLLPKILATIGTLAPRGSTIVDLMCGTASVSEGLRASDHRVIAVDMMTYAVHHARVRLLLSKPLEFEGLKPGSYFNVLERLQSLKPIKGLFFREYSPAGSPLADVPPRMYFTPENAGLIDAMSSQISAWCEAGKIDELENSLLRHDLILAVNRVANIAGTYGHYRSKWSNGSLRPLKLEPAQFIWGYRSDHEVIQGRAEDVAHKITADLCYIDPPYMKRQYAANYHIIETVARGDKPEAIGVSGLRPWRDQYSNFCTKTKIFDSFRRIFTEMDCNTFILSYNEDGLLSKKTIIDMLAEYGEVSSFTIEFNRFRSNSSPLRRKLHEYIFIMKRYFRPVTTLSRHRAPSLHAPDAT